MRSAVVSAIVLSTGSTMRPRPQWPAFVLLFDLSPSSIFAQSAPSITAHTPPAGAVGTSVTISGTGFRATQESKSLALNGVAATPGSRCQQSGSLHSAATEHSQPYSQFCARHLPGDNCGSVLRKYSREQFTCFQRCGRGFRALLPTDSPFP